LGAMLYHLLTGQAPFVTGTIPGTLHAVLHTEAVSPRVRVPGLARDLETICLKCLEKDPARRYATAQQLAEELGRFLHGEPIQARPVNRAEKAWRWCRRKPGISVAIAMTAAALSMAVLFAVQARYSDRQRLAERRQGGIDKTLLAAWSGDVAGAEEYAREA